MKIRVAIQCRDRRTNQVGTFGYFEAKELYSVTPVFGDMIGLIAYCNKHGIKRDYSDLS